jgi:hypothetical protein
MGNITRKGKENQSTNQTFQMGANIDRIIFKGANLPIKHKKRPGKTPTK